MRLALAEGEAAAAEDQGDSMSAEYGSSGLVSLREDYEVLTDGYSRNSAQTSFLGFFGVAACAPRRRSKREREREMMMIKGIA